MDGGGSMNAHEISELGKYGFGLLLDHVIIVSFFTLTQSCQCCQCWHHSFHGNRKVTS